MDRFEDSDEGKQPQLGSDMFTSRVFSTSSANENASGNEREAVFTDDSNDGDSFEPLPLDWDKSDEVDLQQGIDLFSTTKRIRGEDDAGQSATTTQNGEKDPASLAKALKEAKDYDENLDKMLALELGQLSMAELEACQFDLHGVSELIEETSELVESSLQEMKEAVSELLSQYEGKEEASGYQTAFRQCPDYVQNRNMWIAMLRSTNFDAPTAAKKLLDLFSFKIKLFGSENATKDITIQDHFFEQDRACLESGWIQCSSPGTDRAGRTIIWHVPPLRAKFSHMSKMKAMYYLLLECASKDEQSQKRGAVWVILNLGPNRQEDHPDQCQDLAQSNSFVQSVPLRFEGFHICSDAPQRKEFGTLAVAKACDRYRFRSRQHYGSLHELKLVLMSFGIPCSDNVFPRCEQDGYLEFPVESHLSWFRRKVEEEEKTKPPGGTVTTSSTGKSLKEDPGDIVETPGPLDVLVGRSTAIQKNPGNVKFYRLMDQMEKTYESLVDPIEKTIVTMDIVMRLKEGGSRFLRPSNDGKWIIQSDSEARVKVSNSFRDRRKKRKVQKKNY